MHNQVPLRRQIDERKLLANAFGKRTAPMDEHRHIGTERQADSGQFRQGKAQ